MAEILQLNLGGCVKDEHVFRRGQLWAGSM